MVAQSACEHAILSTLAYSLVFEYPLNFWQLGTLTLADKNYDYNTLNLELKSLVRKKKITQKKGIYKLVGSNCVDWKKRYHFSKGLITKSKKTFETLSKIPWIKLIGITGSVAAFNANSDSDIDIFIITEKNRLWITRIFVTLLLKILNMYPRTSREPGKICPNLYIDEKELAWKKTQRNIYIAHDIVLLQPVFNKANTYFEFLKANEWALKYFPNFIVEFGEKLKKTEPTNSPFLNIVENLAMAIQLMYMKNKKTTETTSRHLAHFNKFDSNNFVMDTYKAILEERKIY